MRCVQAGEWRAYLDGELPVERRVALAAHLAGCATCRRLLAEVRNQAEQVSRVLNVLTPNHEPAVNQAWARLAERTMDRGSTTPQQSMVYGRWSMVKSYGRIGMKGDWQDMVRRLFAKRAVWAGLAVVLAAGLALTLAPVQAWAGQFLDSFRVRKFAPVAIDTSQLKGGERQFRAIEDLLSDNVTVVRQPGQPKAVSSLSEAALQSGMPIRLPATLPSYLPAQPSLRVSSGAAARFTVNVDRLRSLTAVAGMDDLSIPQVLDGATVSVDVPAVVMANYGSWELTQLRSPTVDVPPGANLSVAGEAMLRLMGMPKDQAHHFSQTVDWSSTLVIPVPTDAAMFRDVHIDGSDGVLIQSRDGTYGHFAILWQKDGVVYALSGNGSYTDGLAAADSMK